MKKFYSFVLIILSLFSCVLFSACGNKYDDLKMSFYSVDGEVIDCLGFVMDASKDTDVKRVGIKFSGIDVEDIGQVVVYSLPNELVTISNYRYEKDMCYVDVSANRPSVENAKLIVSHLSSGKKESVDLIIEQKSQDLKINHSNYLISIPEVESKQHFIDFSKLVTLLPMGSTDKVYFQIKGTLPINNIIPIKPDVEGLDNVYTGFEVPSGIGDCLVEIYPVAYIDGYDSAVNAYTNKVVTIHFKKVLTEEDVLLKTEENATVENLKLIVNDESLNTFKFSVKIDETNFTETNYIDMYDIEVESSNQNYVSVFVDSFRNIVVKANNYINGEIKIKVALRPINYVGEIYGIEKAITINVETRSNKIEIIKNGLVVENETNIFDYYAEGNSLGSLFFFTPKSNNQVTVNDDLSQMQILVSADILCEENCYGTKPENLANRLYVLEIHNFNEYLKFTYDENRDLMISEPINSDNRIYIKYKEGKGDTESRNFGIVVETLNLSDLAYWENIVPTSVALSFNRQVGVKSMTLQVGNYIPNAGKGVFDLEEVENPKYVYVNRLEGIDELDKDRGIYTKFINVTNGKALGIDNTPVAKANFDVEVIPLGDYANPLTLFNGVAAKDASGQSILDYEYDRTLDDDVVSLIFDKNTSIGEYEVRFSQEGNKKASIIVKVYESLNGIDKTAINFETNETAFVNNGYLIEDVDYIVAAGQKLEISVELNDYVKQSEIIAGYSFSYKMGDTFESATEEGADDYFNKHHDDTLFNNAKLDFIKGTNIKVDDDYVVNYIYLTISVLTIKYDSIVKISDNVDDTTNQVTICFYIYERITDQDISINHTSMTRYMKDYLGVYNLADSQAELQINLTEDLWSYVTIQGLLDVDAEKKVDWIIDSYSGVTHTEIKNDLDLEFHKITGVSKYTRTVKAYVEQFDKIFEFICVFNVEKPIITERLVIDSPVKMRDDQNQNYYINLKNSESYTVEARKYSSKGDVTHEGLIIQVSDKNGSAYNASDYFHINQETSTITVKNVDNSHGFKLIIFAKDALKYVASSDLSGYNSPSSFLIKGEGSEEGLYSNAYFVVEIDVSDGTETSPYHISTADEFWAIDDSEHFSSAYYELQTSISLDNTTVAHAKKINRFKGQITTYNNNIYTIDGITLDSYNKNLFVGFAGKISSVEFKVVCSYNMTDNVSSYVNLGLFDTNDGSITNVGVQIEGTAELNGNAVYYFGGLVGENRGTISYINQTNANNKTESVVGVRGGIGSLSNPIVGNSKVYLGGLVGKNIGKISGVKEEDISGGDNEIIISGIQTRSYAISNVSIYSNLSNGSSIGGVIGLNTYDSNNATKIGTIANAFSQAKIYAKNTSNVGGVIGSNEQNSNYLTVSISEGLISSIENVLVLTYESRAILNVKAASIIEANNNVGGIVGLDKNGLYIDCDYQVLPTDVKNSSIIASNNVGGIAGSSEYGKFLYCSVMSYYWNYENLQTDVDKVINSNIVDILANDYVGGIVGLATSSAGVSNGLINGENQVDRKTIVAYSSVNAYIKSNAENKEQEAIGNIGGIISSNGDSVLFNVYFIGKLEGNVNYVNKSTTNGSETTEHYLCLDNNASSIYNAVYSINLESDNGSVVARIGALKDNQLFTIAENPMLANWWFNLNINGGYIFITKDEVATDNSLPLFDLSPDEINVTVKGQTEAALQRVLMLEYYDFSANSLDGDTLSKLNERYNRNKYVYKIEKDKHTLEYVNVGLLDIAVAPLGIGTVVINVESNKPGVLDVTYDGRLIVNGVGECELTFSSALNPNTGDVEKRTIKVIIDYPIGDTFNISTNKTDKNKIITSTEKIAKDGSRQYYVMTSGSVEIENIDTTISTYSYTTKENTNLKVEVSYNEELTIKDYIMVSGVKNDNSSYSPSVMIVELDNKTPFTISVLKYLETGLFNIKVTPYITVNGKNVYYYDNTEVISTTFDLSTMEGATNVGLSYDDAIVYPNDTIYLTLTIETDLPIDANKLMNVLDFSNGVRVNVNNKDNITYNVYIDSCSYDEASQLQTICIRIEFGEFKLETETKLSFTFETEYGNDVTVIYTILPQRINKLEIKNYYNKNILVDGEITTQLVQEDVLKPSSFGKIVVDIAPSNGYYSYLEISDISGDEEILFIQVDENGNAITVNDDISSDGKGIKLYKQADSSRLFVRTQISKEYSSKLHVVEVRAYSNEDKLLARFTKEIDIKMLPEITVQNILPNGKDGQMFENQHGSMYIANKVDTQFRVLTENVNSEVEVKLSDAGAKFAFIKDTDSFYILKQLEDVPNGFEFTLTLTVYSYLDNGDFDKAEVSINFTVVAFVVHGVSVNSSVDNSTTTEIYGYYEKPISLKFYFAPQDISFYDITATGDKFWNTTYEYLTGIEEEYDRNSSLYQIYSILKEINSYDTAKQIEGFDNDHYGINDYLILNDNNKNVYGEYTFDNSQTANISLMENVLTVNDDYNPEYLAVAFKITKTVNGWVVNKYNENIENSYVVNKNYKLNFRQANAWYEPTTIRTAEEFKAMKSGGRYILANDLTGDQALTNYTPINAELVEFDGNGYTVEIQSFASFNETAIKAGLFAQVYANMIVKNVVVKYNSVPEDGDYTLGLVSEDKGIIYYDICNNLNVNYTEARFGGVAAVNYGIITNCKVEGMIAINASTIEQKKFASGSNYKINFFVGGMVVDNSVDNKGNVGYITNSTSNLNIFAQANIGGFAYSNAGKIVSCGVEEDTTIYSYNINLEKTIEIDVAGFVVNNSNEVSMSYVNLNKGSKLTTSTYQGTISAKDISAGFVLNNSGEIYDAYVQMQETGINNNTFSGFVYNNSGTISRAYTYINSGSITSSDDNMFAPAGTNNIKDCIEIVSPKSGYNNGIAVGLTTLNSALRYSRAEYENQNFAFGDNESSVWLIKSSSLPKLVSTLEAVEAKGLLSFIEEQEEKDGGVVTTLKPNFANYGTKQNPYIIHDLQTWNDYIENNTTAYYRIVKDLNFSVGDNPKTSTMTFSGNIQGNNMKLTGIMLYSSSSLESLGLFKDLKGVSDVSVKNSIRNLTLSVTSVWASKTEAVGVLAGIAENFNLYNIIVDAEGVVMVGGNAVGGLVGLVRGEFDIAQISSNIGANSTRASTLSKYSIYISKNNKENVSANINNVYYAGSVFGILDGYNRNVFNVNANQNVRTYNKGYYVVSNINVLGSVTIIGDTVGGAIGFVGEKVHLKNVNINIQNGLSGVQYSAGAVGENRGVVENVKISLGDNIFNNSNYVSAGAVGLNLGGLVKDVDVAANIVKTQTSKTVAGIVGRNVYGVVSNTIFTGEISGYYVGGVIGANYTDEIILKASTGSGALSIDCKQNINLIPSAQLKYNDGTNTYQNLENVKLSISTLNYMIDTSNKYYDYRNNINNTSLGGLTVKSKVLGLVVGLSCSNSVGSVEVEGDNVYQINKTKDYIAFNAETYNGISVEEVNDVNLKIDKLDPKNSVVYSFGEVNVVKMNKTMDKVHVMYLTGAIVNSFDAWDRTYSNEYIVII